MLSLTTEENIPGKIVMMSNLTAMALRLVGKKKVPARRAGLKPCWRTVNKLTGL
jgi:hypothetical protein